MEGRTGIQPFDLFPVAGYRNRLAAQVKGDFRGAARRFSPSLRRMSRADLMGLAAAGEAAEEAGLDMRADKPRMGVCLGSTTGGMFEAEDYFLDCKKQWV